MLNYKEFMEALKQTIYSQTGWKSDCMGSLTDEGPTSDTALEIHYMNTEMHLLFQSESRNCMPDTRLGKVLYP